MVNYVVLRFISWKIAGKYCAKETLRLLKGGLLRILVKKVEGRVVLPVAEDLFRNAGKEGGRGGPKRWAASGGDG